MLGKALKNRVRIVWGVLFECLDKKEKIAEINVAIAREIKVGVAFAKCGGKKKKVVKVGFATFVEIG